MPPVKKYEPILQYRYIVLIPSRLASLEAGGVGIYVAKSIELPTISYEEVEVDQKSTSFKVKGKVRYNDVQMTLYTNSDTQAVITDWMELHQKMFSGTAEGKYTDYVDTVKIQLQHPDGSTATEWSLYGAFIGEVDFGSADWESSEVIEVTLTLRYDYAAITGGSSQA